MYTVREAWKLVLLMFPQDYEERAILIMKVRSIFKIADEEESVLNA